MGARERALKALQDFGYYLTEFSQKYMPSHLHVALILTLIAFVMALIWGGEGGTFCDPITIILAWGKGFWVLLTFAMQMCLILLTGYIVAVSPPVDKVLARLAKLPNPEKPWQAIFLMGIVTNILAFINWGLSIVGAAIFTIYLVREQPKVDFRLLLATAYLGLGTCWHMGLSASAPLMVTKPELYPGFSELFPTPIPTTRTIFTPWNIFIFLFTLFFTSAFMAAMHPPPEKAVTIPPERLKYVEKWEPPKKPAPEKMTVADRINWWPGWGVIFFIGMLIWCIWWFFGLPGFPGGGKGFAGLNLNSINFIFLWVGLLLHWYPVSFMNAAMSGASRIWGIVIEFPMYAGIFGILRYTYLAQAIIHAFVAISTPRTYPLLVYWACGVLNYFVPSGGSEWIITAPIIIPAGRMLGVSDATVTLVYAWGDMMTDQIQPFWAIALCEITGVRFREMMGYCVAVWIPYMIYMSIYCLIIPLTL